MNEFHDKELELAYNQGIISTLYIPGGSADFAVYIAAQGKAAELHSINGKFRWVVTPENGEPYVARPIDAVVYTPQNS